MTHWNTQRQLFAQNLAALQSGTTTDTVHNLRVNIKKLRSYVELSIALAKTKKDAVQMPDTENLFQALGKYRELELQITNVSKAACPLFESHLQHMKAQAAQELMRTIQTYRETELTKLDAEIFSRVKMPSEKKAITRVQKRIERDWQKVQNWRDDFAEHAHSIRKRLKNVGYWMELLPDDSTIKKPHLKKLHRLLSQLGQAHDWQVFHTRMRHFRKDYLIVDTPEALTLKKLEKKAVVHSKQLIRRAKQSFNAFGKRLL
ncbi:MAG: CHAD domain-containing protein [Cytophagales bacterium]|nr:CHAD domain-containing protein [Cytophagales bacterium]